MTGHDQDTLPGLPDLPGDVRDPSGRRSQKSRYTYFKQRISVEQHHIDHAMRGDSGGCMIADAIKEHVKNSSRISVDLGSIAFTDGDKHRRIFCLTPEPAKRGLVKFDRGFPVQPFTFWLAAKAITQTDSQRKTEGLAKPRVETSPGRGLRENGTKTTAGAEATVVYGGTGLPRHKRSGHTTSRIRKFGVKAFTWDDPPSET